MYTFFFPPKEKSSSPTCVIQMWMAQSFINLNYKMFDRLWYSSIYSSLTPFVVNYRSVYSLGNFYQLFNFYHFCHGRPSKVKFAYNNHFLWQIGQHLNVYKLVIYKVCPLWKINLRPWQWQTIIGLLLWGCRVIKDLVAMEKPMS